MPKGPLVLHLKLEPKVTSVPNKTTTATCEGLDTAYTLTFRGFETEEVAKIETYLASFSGYQHIRPMQVGTRESTYWYETCSDTARLNRNLRQMTEQMGVEVRFGMVQNRFEIDKIRTPKTR
jgi:hypothetical protein